MPNTSQIKNTTKTSRAGRTITIVRHIKSMAINNAFFTIA